MPRRDPLPEDVVDVMIDGQIAIGRTVASLREGGPAGDIDIAILETLAYRLREVLAAHR